MAYTTINKSTDHFNTKLYAGNNTGQSITGVGFEPSLTWIKSRTATERHCLTDAVRGVYKELRSNETAAESDRTSYGGLSAFGADGFTVGGDDGYNNGSNNYASWNWLANGSGSANTDGSISSTVSANTTSGFSIVTYTGTGSDATIGHGLNSAPEMIIQKNTDFAYNWYSWHKDIGIANYIELNTTGAAESTDSAGDSWNNTLPTSSVFSVGSDGGTNRSGDTHLAYCFHSVKGYSKIGSYTGNGNVDGSFIYTGFKPAFVMIKCSSSGGSYTSWSMFDTTRQTFNVNAGKTLYANQNYSEGKRGQGDSSTTIPGIDMLSNGFKCRVLNDEVNNTASYIYMAIGQSLVGSNNVPCTAR